MSITSTERLAHALDTVCTLQSDILDLLDVISDCPLLACAIRDRADLHAAETRAQRALLVRQRSHPGVSGTHAAPTSVSAARFPPLYARSGDWLLARWHQLEEREIQAYQALISDAVDVEMPELVSGCASALDLQRALLQWLSPMAGNVGTQDAPLPILQGAHHAHQESPGTVHP